MRRGAKRCDSREARAQNTGETRGLMHELSEGGLATDLAPDGFDMPMSRRTFVGAAGATGALLLAPSFVRSAYAQNSAAANNIVVEWNKAALAAVRASKLGPPMVARALAMVHTCIYDAWACYDGTAVGTRLGATMRQPAGERTEANKKEAISFAAYRAALDVFPEAKEKIFDPLMAKLGYDTNKSTGAAAVGNFVAQALLPYRHNDGSNQMGNHPDGQQGVPYSDYTGYKPANAAMDIHKPLDMRAIKDPDRWQPLTYTNAQGQRVTPGWLAPHWYLVEGFALKPGHRLRPTRKLPTYGHAGELNPEYRRQALQLVKISANLTDRQKVIAEYWADGPNSEQPPGHWNLMAQFVSRRDNHSLDDDAKMFFALTNAIFDAGIAAWDTKRAYDSVRPITAVRIAFRGKRIRSWAGPHKGVRKIKGEMWLPYQAFSFPTPPFGEYTSGHSTFSAAGAEILRRFTGSDAFGASTTIRKGESPFEKGRVPARTLKLKWKTFSAASDEAGASRRYGGIHFKRGDIDGRRAGRAAGALAWEKAETFFKGTAEVNPLPIAP